MIFVIQRFSQISSLEVGLRVESFKSGQSIVHDPTGVEVGSMSIDPTPIEVACGFEGNSVRKFHKICIYFELFLV